MSAPLTLTDWRRLLLIAAVAAVVVAGTSWLLNRLGVTLPMVPLTAPGLLAIVAAFVAVLGWRMRQRLHVRKEWVDSDSAIRLLALAKAGALAGAAVTGGYAGYLVIFLPLWEVPAARQRVWVSGLAMVTAAALVVAGLFLERACRTPDGDDDDADPPTTGAPDTP